MTDPTPGSTVRPTAWRTTSSRGWNGSRASWRPSGASLSVRASRRPLLVCRPCCDNAILKVIPPEDDDADHIAEALRFWDGHGAVRLLGHDPDRRALLLERPVPGTEASRLDEDQATAVAITVGRRIWRTPPAGHPYRSTHD